MIRAHFFPSFLGAFGSGSFRAAIRFCVLFSGPLRFLLIFELKLSMETFLHVGNVVDPELLMLPVLLLSPCLRSSPNFFSLFLKFSLALFVEKNRNFVCF